MTGFGFVPVTVDVRDEVLLPADGAAVSPTTEQVIAGTRLRGVLAQQAAAAGGDALEVLIASGEVAVGAAFPVLDAANLVGYPAPVTALVSDTAVDGRDPDLDGRRWVIDERDPIPDGAKVARLSGTVAYRDAVWTPVEVQTQTRQRLARPRAGGSRPGMGPVTFTAVAAQQRFRAWFRVFGDAARRQVLADMLAGLLDGRVVAMGAGEQNAYGGDPLFTVGPLSDSAPDTLSEVRSRGVREVDLVLRTAALVTDPRTGLLCPDALGVRVTRLLERVGITGATVSASVRRVAVGGATLGYGRMRPQQWAAAAGSVVRIQLAEPSPQWPRLAGERLGLRTVDGLGAFGLHIPDPPGLATLAAPQRPTVPAGSGEVLLSTGAPYPVAAAQEGVAAEQLALLQHRLFSDATRRWRARTIDTAVAALAGHTSVAASAWGRVRAAAADPQTFTELMNGIANSPDSPLTGHLHPVKINGTPMQAWLTAAAHGDTAALWEPLNAARNEWPAALAAVAVGGAATGGSSSPVQAWIDDHAVAEGQAIVRAVVHSAQQAGVA